MHILGYVIQNASSPKRKVHSRIASTDCITIAHYGPESTEGTVGNPKRHSDLHAAASAVIETMSDKERGGYDSEVVPLCMVEVADDLPPAQWREELTGGYYAKRATTFAFPSAAADSFARLGASGAQRDRRRARRTRADERAAALRLPDDETVTRPNGETYLPRNLGGHTDIAALRRFREAQMFALLAGPPGSGKTALADAAFPDLISVACHGDMTVAHLVGAHLPTADGGWRWEDGPLTRAMKEGLPLYLDEIDKLPAEVGSVLHSGMDGRGTLRIDDRPDSPMVTATEGFYVIAAFNPDTLGGRPLPEAMLSRFTVQIDVTTDFAAARALGVPTELVTVAENLRSRSQAAVAQGGRGVWVPQMRELLAGKRLADAGLGLTFAASAMVAQCPFPEELAEVCDAASDVVGGTVAPLTLGAQV